MTESGARKGFAPETLYSETYRGRTITVRTTMEKGYLRGFVGGQAATYQRDIDGKAAERITIRLRRVIDMQHADDIIRDRAQLSVGTFAYVEGAPTVKNPKVGDQVCGSAFGRMRRGVVETVKRTGTVVVAYITPSSPGEVRRMTLKPNEIFDPRFMRQIG